MRINLDKKIECSGCGACIEVCPKKCITIKKDELGFNYATFRDTSSCIDCGKCIKVCPQKKTRPNQLKCKSIYYGKSKDSDVVINSTSGGIFSIISSYIIERGGVVWGVSINDNGYPVFTCIDNMNSLHMIRGSKYVEVNSPLPYTKIRQQLEDGIDVLVSGTPCQMLALKKFLGDKYPNLYTLDLFCYGVQSPYMWSRYLGEINCNCKQISEIKFRCKKKSWWDYSMLIKYADNSSYSASRWEDPWLLSYAKALYNRESCAKCEAKKFPKETDFTLGDFWAIEWYLSRNPCIEKKEGVSIIFLHSVKAQKIFDKIKDKLIISELSIGDVIRLYPKLGLSNTANEESESFIRSVNEKGFRRSVLSLLPHGKRYKYKLIYRRNITLLKLIIKKILK